MKKHFLYLFLILSSLAFAQASQAQQAPSQNRLAARGDSKKETQPAIEPEAMAAAMDPEETACTWVWQDGRWYCVIFMIEGHTDDSTDLSLEVPPEDGVCHYVSIHGNLYCMSGRVMK